MKNADGGLRSACLEEQARDASALPADIRYVLCFVPKSYSGCFEEQQACVLRDTLLAYCRYRKSACTT